MSFSRIDVVADVGQLPPDQVRSSVTLPMEQALQALPSALRVRSTSSQGSSEVVVDFASGTDPQVDLNYVNQALAQLRNTVPAAQNIVAVIVNPSSEPVLAYALTSDQLSQATLHDIATYQIVPKLYGAAGLGRLLVTGGPTTEFHVDLDPAALTASGIGASDVVHALSDQNTIQAVGLAQQNYQRYAILVDASLRDVASLSAVAIPTKNSTSVPLSALGTVKIGVSPTVAQTSFNGHHGVIVNAYALPGADVVVMANDLKARLATVLPTLPRIVKFDPYWDQTTFIINSQTALRDAILIGALLAIIVIYVFLRDWRLTLVAGAVIPLAMSIAIFVLQISGQTLNLMSVGGLAVAVGLIIDDAIVVIENIARTMREHPDLGVRDAVERAMAQIAGPMIASTTTTVVVFVPLALLTGVAGFFFRALASTMAASLIVSLGLALFVAPIAATLLLRGRRQHDERADAIGAVLGRYDHVLRWALGHRLAVAAGSVAVLVVTVVLLARLPSEFLPKSDEGKFEIGYILPVGTTLEASDASATTMEQVIVSDPAVVSVGRLSGVDTNGFSPTPQNVGLLRVTLVDPSKRQNYDDVSNHLRDRLQAAIPSAAFDFHQILEDQLNGLEGSASPIEIDIHGPDQQTLIHLADSVVSAINGVPGLVDTNNGVVYDNPSLRIAPNAARLAGLGLTAADVTDAYTALAQGTVATTVPQSTRVVPVRVSVRGTQPLLDPSAPLLAKGVPSAIGSVATLNTVRLASDINADNGQLVVRVTGNTSGSLSSIVAGIRQRLTRVHLPAGYSLEIAGQAKTQAQSFNEFLTVIAIAVALVFAVMLATFRSFRLPLVILTAIPLALIGVALALALSGTPFNVSSFMGLLLLVGIVVKNGILLIDVANRRRAEGDSIEDSLLAAGKTRLRPIVMTTLAAIGGLVPLALGIGQGAELEKPLAIAVIGGLSTATIFTLIVIPVLYAAFMGRSSADVRQPARETVPV